MNDEELKATLEEVKAQVKAKPENKDKSDDEIDEMILDAFFKEYSEGGMTKEDLGALAEAMGYEFTEDFDKDPEAADKVEGQPDLQDAEGVSQEDLEEVRTMEPGESKEEFKEKIGDVAEGKGVEGEEEESSEEETETEDDDEEDSEDDEDEERKKASELWKLNLNK